MTSVGIVLSGCGVNDGTEIHEAVITMLCLDQKKCRISFFAPDINQASVIDHINGVSMPESRNILIESARISRGNIRKLEEADPENLDALIIPGGSGVLKNLSKILNTPKEPYINDVFKNLILNMHKKNKPIGSICISPVIISAVLSEFKPELTIGNDINASSLVESFGGIHKSCKADEICVDEKNRLVSTPAYMLANGPFQVYEGISKLVEKIISMIQ